MIPTLLTILFAIVSFVVWRGIKRLKYSEEYILDSEREFNQAVEQYNRLFNGYRYVSYSMAERWRTKYNYLNEEIDSHSLYLLPTELKSLVREFKICFDSGEKRRRQFNDKFVEQQKIHNANLFNTLLKFPLDTQQREVILHDEDNTLVIAGAGTGKTTTIMGKIAYILENKLASKEEILLISFTSSAVRDMREALAEIGLNEGVTVKTFNALGYSIIGEVEGSKPNLLFGGAINADIKTKELLSDSLRKKDLDKNLRVLLANFFLYYIFPQPDIRSFDTLDEYYSYVKSIKLVTFQGEIVKSFEELEIANFLYLHNIEYQYEKIFDPELKSRKFTSYKPDFYLPEYDITIEHFGIDKDGRVPKFFTSNNEFDATEKYHKKMEYAREVHRERGRTLIETYSFEKSAGELLTNLEDKLVAAGVMMTMRPLEEVLQKITVGKSFSPFIDLVYTFLNLVKSNHLSLEHLQEIKNQYTNQRVSTFMEIFVYLFDEYESYLMDHNEIDFNDMIIRSTQYIESGQYHHPYKYILVDEFQDMSVGRYSLLKSLLDQKKDTKLFCVGDDWQSIFRFTGSDISLTTSFSDYFGYTYKGKLEATHRFNNKILDYSSDFIQVNPSQLKKHLVTDYHVDDSYKALDIRCYSGETNAGSEQIIISILEEIIEREQGKDKPSVLLLGRYNHNRPARLNQIEYRFKKYFRNIEFLTVHKAKGATFEYSILIDVNTGLLGFPSEIVDDPLLQLVLNKGDDFKNAEERRLFYVALTRTRNANYIITQSGKESKFVKELQKGEHKDHQENTKSHCPQCHGELVERQGKFGPFYGCRNYPLCDFVLSHSKALKLKNKL
jgi:DNA helicase IV